MAVVDVIDLTVSSPPVIVIDDDIKGPADPISLEADSKERKRRKKRRKDERERGRHERYKHEVGDRRPHDSWKHDRFKDEDEHRQRNKRRGEDEATTTKNPRKRAHSLTPPLFSIDTTKGHAFPTLPPMELVSVDPIPTHPLPTLSADIPFKPHAEPPIAHGLLLPAHVTVATNESESVQNEDPRLSPHSDASGIDFLDDDRAVGAPRYFHDTTTHTRSTRSRGPCTNCGDEDHDFKICPNMICMTCGARNEHGSRSCPILRFCWKCNAKGHVIKDCPRSGNMDRHRINRPDCERCGSWKHHETNCPTLWRIYTYLTDAERNGVLADRESKRQLGFDKGGEGYIARDQWCYNCGGRGHLGDDCGVAAAVHDRPDGHSAFGSFNELSGPFASPSSVAPKFERPPRAWEEGSRFDDGHGFLAESNVGKRSRENIKARARETQRLLEKDDDEPDWFSMNQAGSTKGKAMAKPSSREKFDLPPKIPPSKIHFGFRSSHASKAQMDSGSGVGPPSHRSLHDRIGDRRHTGHSQGDRELGDMKRPRGVQPENAGSQRRGNGRRDRRHHSSRDDSYQERASRWRGGYNR